MKGSGISRCSSRFRIAKRTLLIDADIVVYKSGFGVEKSYLWGDDEDSSTWSVVADLDEGKQKLDDMVADMKSTLKADEVLMCMTDGINWRKELYPEYKANRKTVRKPVLIKPLMEYVSEVYSTYVRPSLEADDVLGILATAQVIKGDKIICSIDKDLLQIPGKHWNIDKRALSVVSEEDGDRTHQMQSLTGDMTDNYPGCPGLGPKGAAKLIDKWAKEGTPYWQGVVETYAKKGLNEDYALIQARIARICRAADYDFPTRTVRLWTP